MLNRLMTAMRAFANPQGFASGSSSSERKDNPVGSLTIPFYEGQEICPPDGYERLSQEGYRNAAVVRAVIMRISRAAAALPIKLQRHSAGGEWADLDAMEDDEHPLMQLIRKPNPRQTKVDFFESVFASRFLAGESFILPNGPAAGLPPTELWWVRPDRMHCIPGTNGLVDTWIYKVGRGSREFKMDVPLGTMTPVLQWKTFNPTDEWRGLSILASGKMQLCQVNEGARWNAQTLKNGARPAGAFVYKPDDKMGRGLSEDQRKQLKQDIHDKISGASNAAEPMILDNGLSWQEMSINPKDLDWLEGMRDANRTICFLLNYPPIMLGIPGDATYKNYEEARTSFYQDTAIPLFGALLLELNEWLVPQFGDDLRLVLDEAKVDALDSERAEKWDRIEKSTIMTVNEKRVAVGMEELDDPSADEIWISSSMVPLSESTQMAQDKLGANDPAAEDSATPQGKKPLPGQKPGKGKQKLPQPGKKDDGDETYRAGLVRLQGLVEKLGKIGSKP